MTVSDGVSPSAMEGGGGEPARLPLNSPLTAIYFNEITYLLTYLAWKNWEADERAERQLERKTFSRKQRWPTAAAGGINSMCEWNCGPQRRAFYPDRS